MNLKNFRHNDWVQIWEGGWSFLSCSHFGDQYTKEVKFGKRPFVSKSVIFSHSGRSTAWIRQSDRDILGKYLAQQIKRQPSLANKITKNLKAQVDIILPFEKKYIKNKISIEIYKKFWEMVVAYYHPHINVKYIVDYLDKYSLKKLLPSFESARLYAEPVFELSEKFVYNFAKQVSKQSGYPSELILSLTKKELYDYFSGSALPDKKELLQRYNNSALVFDETRSQIFVNSELKKIEKIIFGEQSDTTLTGVSAFPGKVTAIARVINDPKKGSTLKSGEILISGMTRPEFLPIMKRASAFVTDSGGVLCHAAIVAREMKKPCITGTKLATKVFKDGDLVEVDADKGIVRKIYK